MKRELVAVKIKNKWDIILNVTLSENKNLINEQETIEIIRENCLETVNADFIVDENNMFVLLDNMTTVNPGNACKI